MKVTYRNPGFDYSIESIILFQSDGETPFWSNSLFYFYPEIDKNMLTEKDASGKKQYIKDALAPVYKEICPELEQKVSSYNEYFLKILNSIL